MIKNFYYEWIDMWEYNWQQNYVSKWNPIGFIYAYKEVSEKWIIARELAIHNNDFDSWYLTTNNNIVNQETKEVL